MSAVRYGTAARCKMLGGSCAGTCSEPGPCGRRSIGDNVAVIGHSRGGGTAFHLARAMSAEFPFDPPWRVCVVSLRWHRSRTDLIVDQNVTPAMMLIHATMDSDQHAPNSFKRYDTTASEDEPVFPNQVHKSMKLLNGGSHGGFADLLTAGRFQRRLTKGYVLAFLSSYLKEDPTWTEGYVRGELVPRPVGRRRHQPVQRWRRAPRPSTTSRDHEIESSTIGGVVRSVDTGLIVLDLDPAPGSPHVTKALWMRGSNSGSSVTWTIPAGERDVSAFRRLSMRIGRSELAGDVEDLRVSDPKRLHLVRRAPSVRLRRHSAAHDDVYHRNSAALSRHHRHGRNGDGPGFRWTTSARTTTFVGSDSASAVTRC